MTREEAIYRLKNTAWLGTDKDREETEQAVDMAIEALHREEAEEKGYCHRIIPSNVEVVVRCKDCRFSEIFQNDSSGVRAMYCRAFTFERMVSEDDYCSYGERKEP